MEITYSKGKSIVNRSLLSIGLRRIGAHIFRVYPDLEEGCLNAHKRPGFLAEYFMTSRVTEEPFLIEEFPRGSFTTLMNTRATGCKTVKFTTTYIPITPGAHYLSFSGLGPSKFYINDELVAHQKESTKDAMGFLLGVQEEIRTQFFFEVGKEYNIVVETHPSPTSNAELYLLDNQCSVHLGLISQEEMEQDVLAEAVSLAKDADLAIVFVGNTTQWETEGQDLESMSLPANGSQDDLIVRVAAANPNTIVINTTGVPVELPWIDSVPAFLQAWYAGQETGNAILDVLLGEMCPSGRLPISWPKRYEHTGCFGNFGLDSFESRQVNYIEGVFVGYRWFDNLWGGEKEVRFPFGFGLSYTTFEITDTSINGSLSNDAHHVLRVSMKVKNVGKRLGAEIVQVYLKTPVTEGLERPQKTLVGFEKIELRVGEEREVQITIGKENAAFWDENLSKWRVSTGVYEVLIATSSHPRDCRAVLETAVEDELIFKA